MNFDRKQKDILYQSQSSLKDDFTNEETKRSYYQDHDGCNERARIEEENQGVFKDARWLNNLVTYQGNKNIPYLCLYRYKEAFSFQLVDLILRNFEDENLQVFDPYSGMGTTLFASAYNGIEAYGMDKLPLAVQMSNSLLDAVIVDIEKLNATFTNIYQNLNDYPPAEIAGDVSVVQRVIPEQTKLKLRRWKAGINDVGDERVSSVLKMIYLSILLDCSYAKNSGQFLRTDKSQNISEPSERIREQIDLLETSRRSSDIADKEFFRRNKAWIGDSRDMKTADVEPNMVITSPPYPNRYDYTRSYSLELAFEFVDTNDELIELRHNLLRSHIESKVSDKKLKGVHPVVDEVLENLNKKDLNNNKIPDMIVGYFKDMRESVQNLSNLVADDAKIFLVVDNVRYEGEVIPVDLIIADIAKENGFDLERLMITRYKGNSSQQMGKYDRVPVRESILCMKNSQ